MENRVVIVGAGPAGLATAACLNKLSISNVVFERENCYASLWKNKAYDRLKLHLAKRFCQLPHMPFPPHTPNFVPKLQFINYLDNYVSTFNINIRYNRSVECAFFNEEQKCWCIRVKNNSHLNDVDEVYMAKFLVVAIGENSDGIIPEVSGLNNFRGEIMHSSAYTNGKDFEGRNVLVVGGGNSGFEIAYDLSHWGANPSIVVRSPVHVMSKEIIEMGMQMLSFRVPISLVDSITLMLSKFKFGDLSPYGIRRPTGGPFSLKAITGRSPTIDVGAVELIKNGQIKVYPGISSIDNDNVQFVNGETCRFDAIIFATGYRSTVRKWLKDYKELFNEEGMPKKEFPNHWKGENGLYCAGFARRGLQGISMDAQNIARDIEKALI